MTIKLLIDFVNDKFSSLSKGSGLDSWDNGVDLVKIDEPLKLELLSIYDKNKSLVNLLGGIDETTTAASSGAFVAPLSAPTIKRDIDGENNDLDIPVVGETTSTTSAGNYQYDANALPNIGRNGNFKTGNKPKAYKSTQYAGGGFVDIDDCTKLNNNKTAQNGKCSQGGSDGVVKVKKSKDNINAPSLGGKK